MTSPRTSVDPMHLTTPQGDPVDLEPDTVVQPTCPCHDSLDCPDEATVPVRVRELARLGELLGEVDQFLRSGTGVVDLLAGFYTARGQAHPRFHAGNLVDAVSLAAASRLFTAASNAGGEQ